MKASTPLHQNLYSPVERQSHAVAPLAWQKRLRQCLRTVATVMVDSTDPQIRQLRDGDLRWRAYDPISRQASYFTSEHELRQWLEQRYYR